jgi:hypothetical protein
MEINWVLEGGEKSRPTVTECAIYIFGLFETKMEWGARRWIKK